MTSNLETAPIPITLTGKEWAALCVQFVLNESLSADSAATADRAKIKIMQAIYRAAKMLGPEPPAPARPSVARRIATAALVGLATAALVGLLLFGTTHLASAQPPLAGSLWDHNGSAMRLVETPNGQFGVYYEVIRPGLIETIPPGAPRFEGQQIGNRIVGNAFVYTKYCPGASFPYHVEGVAYGGTIELFGPAAVVDPRFCAIVGYRPDSDNAHIIFHLVQPVAMTPPPLLAEERPVAAPRSQAEWRENLKRQGREFCRRYPTDPVCKLESQ